MSKVSLLLFVCVLALSATLAQGLKLKAGALKPAAPQIDLCKPCIDFMDEALQELIEIIANGGVLGSCGALCSMLPNSVEGTICDLLCDVVGIDEFIKLLNDVDPDPIFICEELTVCPHRVGQVTINSTSVAPPVGHKGDTFTMSVVIQVEQETGTGEVFLEVIPPGYYGEPLSDGLVIESLTPGPYEYSFSLEAKPSEDEPFSPGQYLVVFAVCEGSCGSKHKWAFQYANATNSFTLRG